MKVCVVGSGGREHALATTLARTSDVVVTPGNAGIPGSVATPPEEVDADLFVIGPEAPLVDGLADRLRAAGRLVFGPGADGSRLEGSKAWMKEILADAGVPSARYASFTELEPALAELRRLEPPYVIKTDGLAAGKGVLVTTSLIDAEDDVRAKLAGESFGTAGRRVVIEEGMIGPEVSLLVVCDGHRGVPLSPAQDFKRIGEGDTGPNTGGMGAYSPVAVAGPDLVSRIMTGAVEPTLAALRERGIDYRGVLYAGIMLTDDGAKVIEYNIRFGDPESQVVLPRLTSDLAGLLAEAASGELRSEPRFSDEACVTVVCASAGYPGDPHVGEPIAGIAEAEAMPGVQVFLAGVIDGDRAGLLTGGGRVLDVTATGATVAEARDRAYAAVARISFPGMQFRPDIAAAAAEEEARA